MTTNPLLDVDEDARQLARRLIAQMQHAVLAVTDPAHGAPHLSRIAAQPDLDGTPMGWLSAIAIHSRLLTDTRQAGLLIEDARASGEAMTRPRLSLQVIAVPQPRDDARNPARMRAWLARNPKARVYATLPDFRFWRLEPQGGLLNAGFGRACRLSADDLKIPPERVRRGD
ncbi:hypothetical protein SAMN05421538_10574 [Paracoccus isoporae]|uniref:Pyridoxamine 5'-phosphate oxidase putative domain-containing protein n=1 Tax=Paracoccus isoporae TaxID=591205 RepID=A0A1G7BEX8_9RHOB|nr:hypothetical protein [Paracoccus isoporae]SDE25599.1 hypothetical protein SAMN05421538_10574 [Paracoccus isoporae]